MKVGDVSHWFRGWSSKTLRNFYSIWVVDDRLTKSAHFISVRIDYNVEQLAKVYVKEMVRLHEGTSLSS